MGVLEAAEEIVVDVAEDVPAVMDAQGAAAGVVMDAVAVVGDVEADALAVAGVVADVEVVALAGVAETVILVLVHPLVHLAHGKLVFKM
jgi:hypothetical protein